MYKVIVLLGLLLSSNIFAASNPFKDCAGDVQKLCPGVKPGQGRIHNCLKAKTEEIKANPDLVSKQCYEAMRQYGQDYVQGVMEIGKACQADTQKYCQGVKAGEKRIANCLAQQEQKAPGSVSDTCKNMVSSKYKFMWDRYVQPLIPAKGQ